MHFQSLQQHRRDNIASIELEDLYLKPVSNQSLSDVNNEYKKWRQQRGITDVVLCLSWLFKLNFFHFSTDQREYVLACTL